MNTNLQLNNKSLIILKLKFFLYKKLKIYTYGAGLCCVLGEKTGQGTVRHDFSVLGRAVRPNFHA